MIRAFDLLLRGAEILAAVAAGICAVTGTADVIMTAVFHRPVQGALEVMQMMMVVIVFGGLAAMVRRGEEIRVGALRDVLTGRARRACDSLSTIASVAVYGIIAWAGTEAALRSLSRGEFTSGAVQIPIAPSRIVLAFGASLAAAAALTYFIRAIRSAR